MARGKKKSKKSKPTARNQASRLNPPDKAVEYKGPLKIPLGLQQRDTITHRLTAVSSLTSSGSGTFNVVAAALPSNFQEFSALATIFDECRVLSLTVHYVPNYSAGQATLGTTIVQQVGCIVLDRDSNGALTSYAGAWAYPSCKMFTLDRKMSFNARMSGVEDAGWITTASPPTPWWFKYFFAALPNSTLYGQLFYELMCQFRGSV
jgi:hypothetical protein